MTPAVVGPLRFPRSQRSITGELQEATSKYGRKYGWQHPVLRVGFRGMTPRNSGRRHLISWQSRARANTSGKSGGSRRATKICTLASAQPGRPLKHGLYRRPIPFNTKTCSLDRIAQSLWRQSPLSLLAVRQRRHALSVNFVGTWPRNSSDQNLILWPSHQIRSFDDHNIEAPHLAVDTGAPTEQISRPCHGIPQ